MLGPERPVILFEDAHLLAVGKPAGLLTQGIDAGEPTLETVVRRHLARGAGDSAYVGTVHRLDRPVSGVVVWAKTPKAARRLADQFARREVGKLYWAIVEGDAAAIGPGGIWDDWLAPVDASGVVRVVDPHAPGANGPSRGSSPDAPIGCRTVSPGSSSGRRRGGRINSAPRPRRVAWRSWATPPTAPCGRSIRGSRCTPAR